jgi:universal stress protein E
MHNLLVALNDPQASKYLFEKVIRLADTADPLKIHVVQVVHEGVADLNSKAIDGSAELKSFILSAAESQLEEWVEPLRARCPDLECATLWNARNWEGIIHAADRVDADLILTSAGAESGLGSVVRTPDDWNLLRHSQVPVMLVKEAAWPKTGSVLCALDPFDEGHVDLNVRLLQRASGLASRLNADLNLVCAYPLFEPWVGELGAVKSYTEIKDSIEAEIREQVAELVKKADVDYQLLLLEEGQPAQALTMLVEKAAPLAVVVGTHARKGVSAVVLGNTSERLLHHLSADMMTVPAPDQA